MRSSAAAAVRAITRGCSSPAARPATLRSWPSLAWPSPAPGGRRVRRTGRGATAPRPPPAPRRPGDSPRRPSVRLDHVARFSRPRAHQPGSSRWPARTPATRCGWSAAGGEGRQFRLGGPRPVARIGATPGAPGRGRKPGGLEQGGVGEAGPMFRTGCGKGLAAGWLRSSAGPRSAGSLPWTGCGAGFRRSMRLSASVAVANGCSAPRRSRGAERAGDRPQRPLPLGQATARVARAA